MKVFIAAAAKHDIAGIGDWIAEDSPKRAASFMRELVNACHAIGHAPRGSVVVQRYVDSEIRRKSYYDYLIFYRIVGETVEIIHVVHGSRDYSKLL